VSGFIISSKGQCRGGIGPYSKFIIGTLVGYSLASDSGVPPLPFGVEGIEREGRFARAGDACYYYLLVPGDRDADIFEVVLAGALGEDVFHCRC
jgi:hypothetical protein